MDSEEESCPFRTRYSYAFCKTKDAFGRSFILKLEEVCHLPSLSAYLLCRVTVLNSTCSLFFLLLPLFFQTVALIAPVLNFFSGWLPVPVVFPIYIASFAVRILFHTSLSYELYRNYAPGSEVVAD